MNAFLGNIEGNRQAYVCIVYIKYLISVCCRAEHFFMENNYKIIIMYLIHDEKKKKNLIRLFWFNNCIVNAHVCCWCWCISTLLIILLYIGVHKNSFSVCDQIDTFNQTLWLLIANLTFRFLNICLWTKRNEMRCWLVKSAKECSQRNQLPPLQLLNYPRT